MPDAKLGDRKLDGGKPPLYRGVLCKFPRALRAVAGVSAFGAKKYEVPVEATGYADVEDGFNRYSDAVVRHLVDEIIDGPVNHEDGDLNHAAQVAWDALARLEIMLRNKEKAS